MSVEIQTSSIGKDMVFLVTGGEAHIGAVAIAYPSDDRVIVNVLPLPGHQEAELAAELAEMASFMLKSTVTVLAGIHLDSPTKQEIAEIVTESKIKMKQILKIL